MVITAEHVPDRRAADHAATVVTDVVSSRDGDALPRQPRSLSNPARPALPADVVLSVNLNPSSGPTRRDLPAHSGWFYRVPHGVDGRR